MTLETDAGFADRKPFCAKADFARHSPMRGTLPQSLATQTDSGAGNRDGEPYGPTPRNKRGAK